MGDIDGEEEERAGEDGARPPGRARAAEAAGDQAPLLELPPR